MKNFRALLAWLTAACCIALLVLVPDPIYPSATIQSLGEVCKHSQ
jgi:hypothetical protein